MISASYVFLYICRTSVVFQPIFLYQLNQTLYVCQDKSRIYFNSIPNSVRLDKRNMMLGKWMSWLFESTFFSLKRLFVVLALCWLSSRPYRSNLRDCSRNSDIRALSRRFFPRRCILSGSRDMFWFVEKCWTWLKNQYNAFWDDQRSERDSGPCTCKIVTGCLQLTCARHSANRSLTVYQI